MEDVSRRSLFRIIVASTASSIAISPALAQQVHAAVAEAKSLSAPGYQPKCFTSHYFATVKILADMIIPADEHSGGAAEAGSAEFIDLLSSRNPELAAILNGGMMWIDQAMNERHGTDFIHSTAEQRKAMLDSLAWKKNATPQTAYGVRSFTLLREIVVDAFYTSPSGVKDIGYLGNTAVAKFEVPTEAVQYVLKRSPFADAG